MDIVPILLLHVRVREGVRGLLLEVPTLLKKVSWGSGELAAEDGGEWGDRERVLCLLELFSSWV